MTDTTVAALTADEIAAMRQRHSYFEDYCDTCFDYAPCLTVRALDALDAAQRRVGELEAIEAAAKRLAVRQSGDYQAYLDDQRAALADLRAVGEWHRRMEKEQLNAAPHDAPESACSHTWHWTGAVTKRCTRCGVTVTDGSDA